MSDTSRLPKWAQERIKDLEREKQGAVDALNGFCANQKPSKIYVEDHPCTGENKGPSFKRSYIQGHTVNFEHANIELRVCIFREGYIEISASSLDRRLHSDVFIRPVCNGRIDLVSAKLEAE